MVKNNEYSILAKFSERCDVLTGPRMKTWAVGLLCILLTLSVVGYNIHSQKKIDLQEAREHTANLLNLAAIDLDRTFSGLDQLFSALENSLAPASDGRQVDPPGIRRVIDDLVLENPHLTALMVLDQNGHILHWNNNFQKPNLSSRDYFNFHKTVRYRGLYFGQPLPSLINQGQWICGISKAVRSVDGSLSLVLAAIIDLKYFDRQYQPMLTTPGTTLTVSSPDGHIYARIPDPDKLVGRHLPVLSTTNGKRFEAGGSLTMSRLLEDYPLLVTVTKEKPAVLAGWRNRTVGLVLTGLVVSLTLLFFTYRTALFQRRQQQIREEMYVQSGIDPLTQLVNQQQVLELAQLEIKKAVRNHSSMSVVLMELDRFKEINTRYSHQRGDDILENTAGVLRQCSRATDILSRFCGVKFLILLPDTDLQGAMVLARKVHKRLQQRSHSGAAGEFQVTASIGVSQWAPGETEIMPAIERADAALYEVKKNGRNNIRWMPSSFASEDIEGSVVWLHSKDRVS